MRTSRVLIAVLLGLLLAAPMVCCAQAVPAEAFSASAATNSSVEEGDSSASNAQGGGLYSDGTRAINESRWSDAVTIFTKVASEHGEHAGGALYWKAYAENKLGQSSVALNTCAELRRDHPKSRWMDECGALEIEIRAKSGQPIQPQAEQDEDLKLLALNSLMKQDELRALSAIQQILTGDSPEQFKERALFILAQGQSKQAQELLEQMARGHSNPALQAKAAEMLANRRDKTGSPFAVSGQNAPPRQPGTGRQITLDVQVTDKFGTPIRGLQEKDFTVRDDKQPQKIVSFHAVNDGAGVTSDPPVEIVLVVDAINTYFRDVSYVREEVKKFLLQNGGKLAWPVSLVIFSEAGTKIQNGSSRDGNALAALYDQYRTGLRSGNLTNGGYWGETERIDISLKALASIVTYEKTRPGRKLMIWFSRGWPMLSATRTRLTSNDAQQLFNSIVAVSTDLRQARITLYSVDPFGAENSSELRNTYYEEFLKGVTSPSRALPGNLGLQVLAYQSGGRVLNSSNDVAGELAKCLDDASFYYIVTFNAPKGDGPNEYHALDMKVDKPGLTARTRTGYYAQP